MIRKGTHDIYVKGGFWERKGIKHFSDIVQVNSLNERTRNKIYSATIELIEKDKKRGEFIEYIYTEIFSLTKNDIPIKSLEFGIFSDYYADVENEILLNLRNCEYYEVFDFIEGIIRGIRLENQKKWYIEEIEKIFKEENVNYKIIGDLITDIINENQIDSIEETINNPYKVVSEHYSKAIEQLYSVKDYANSIKESISAVEAMCQVINGSKEELNKALKNLKITIHPALEQAYIKLYAYTCDENGSRHANGIGEKNATFEEAKYMLISCSAFVNYLKGNMRNKNE